MKLKKEVRETNKNQCESPPQKKRRETKGKLHFKESLKLSCCFSLHLSMSKKLNFDAEKQLKYKADKPHVVMYERKNILKTQ